MLFQELEICNEDIEYFNNNCQNKEDLESLIFQLEIKEAEIFTNSISNNNENENSSIDSKISQLTNISNATKILKSEKSPYLSLIKYTNENKNIYESYAKLRQAEIELDRQKNNPELSITSALNYLEYVLQQVNPFNNRSNIKYFTTESFCQSLSFIQQFLNNIKKNKSSFENNDKIYNVFQECEDKIRECPFSNINPLFPLLSFYPYLLDPCNNHLFKKYFEKFTKEYCKYLLNQYIRRRGREEQDPTQPNFFILIQPFLHKRHYHTIRDLNKIIEYEIKANEFQLLEYQKNKIINIIDTNLVNEIVSNIKSTSSMNYNDFTGTTLDDLREFEEDSILIKYKRIIEKLNENNFAQYFRNNATKIAQLNLIYKLANIIKSKFDNIDQSLRHSNSTDRFPKLVELVQCIDFFNNNYNYQYTSDLRDFLYKKAIEKGKADISNFILQKRNFFRLDIANFFLDIRDESYDSNIKLYNEKYNEFKVNFVFYHPKSVVADYYLEYLYNYSHGFLSTFCDNWMRNVNSIKNEISKLADVQFTIETCCIKFIYILYIGLELEPSQKNSVEKPIFDPDHRFDLSALRSNIEILKNSKKDCYQDLLNIVNTII